MPQSLAQQKTWVDINEQRNPSAPPEKKKTKTLLLSLSLKKLQIFMINSNTLSHHGVVY